MVANRKNALITGASSGIGKAIAYKLASEGYDLLLVSRRIDILTKIKLDIENTKQVKVEIFKTDLTEERERNKLIKTILEQTQQIDILINNAGGLKWGKIEDLGWEEMRKMIELHVSTPTHFTLELLPLLKRSSEKSIIFISSSIVYLPKPGVSVYPATKVYSHYLADVFRKELSSDFFVFTLCPRRTNTELPFIASLGNIEKFPDGDTSEHVANTLFIHLKKRKRKTVLMGLKENIRRMFHKNRFQ